MYAVVGCGECSALWVVEGRPETTTCPSCGKRHRFEALKKFAQHESGDAAREARTRLLAARSDHAPDELDSFSTLESRAETGGMSDAEYLERSGLDPDRTAAAATGSKRSKGRMEVVRESISALDDPTESNVVARAERNGIPADYTERALERLSQRGAVSRHDGRYRLL
ncbi:DUF5817 domain-containing protein [Halococcus hamelinensis]|uniref:Uncharacterized protein n=1 Tax=Halococcus hamelinensis 100A6 TaxID=1132509 RepID=M0M855_9EURY|nr:DUF5817 domain-containing protein [Halococcus hamelinensis]EMA40799.1 hypothetical protein C447_03356 [Halococcus hamelinensis 100A6]